MDQEIVMKVVADLHLHSKYSRAVSKDMELGLMAEWGRKKGIDLLATGDWTHPLWFKELETNLEEDSEGIYKVKGSKEKTRFVLSGEIANIYKKGDRARRIHTVFLVPKLKSVRKINEELVKRGGNLMSDGRPILGLTLEDMCEVVWEVDERVIVLPAHCWTPWFAMFGSKSGFDSVEEAFGRYSDRIYSVETGLSSDPLMNWRIKDLEKRSIVSFSDAHSPRKIGREATVFTGEADSFTFGDLSKAMSARMKGENEGKFKIGYTIEFYPEEGKYHYTGHRNCKVVQSPEETRKKGTTCHVCGRPLTVGVEHRVEELAQHSLGKLGEEEQLSKGHSPLTTMDMKAVERVNKAGVKGYYHPKDETRPPYVMLVPLQEIISEAVGVGVGSKKVQELYEDMLVKLGSEFDVLLKQNLKKIAGVGGEKVAQGIDKVRKGEIVVKPGYDGEFGVVKIWDDSKSEEEEVRQESLF